MSAPLRTVLVLGLNYPPEPTGISPYTGAMAQGVSHRGFDVRALTAHPHYPGWKISQGYGQWSRDENMDGVRVRRLRHYVPSRPSGIRRAVSELSFGIRQASQRWRSPDAIIAVSPGLLSTAVAQLRATILNRRTPFVVWVQDLYSLGLSETSQSGGTVVRVMKWIEGRVLRRATRVVVIHERFAHRISEDFCVPMERIEVIRNWAHLQPATPIDRDVARRSLGWGADETIVLHAGNMGVKQGLSNVVDAARLAQAEDRKVRFVMLGGGSERARLVLEAAGIDAIEFVDPLADEAFSVALQAADMLLVNERPGVAEMAVPSKLTSYFSAARPVIAATDRNGITAEELSLAAAGVIVAAGDPRALLDATLALAADPARAEAYGSNGRRFRDTVLDESTALDAFEAILCELIDTEAHHSRTRYHSAPTEVPR